MLNKTFRLFISSTFSDFIAERNILNDKIFPTVDDYCQRRGYNFQLVDLRWGVTNESTLNQNTLAICLDEVRRCRTLSPKPNFLLMAGERYGWVPLPTNISTNEFKDILSVASEEEKQIITEWYIFDGNKIGGEYYLKNRRGEYTDDALWSKTEGLLSDALKNCIINKLKSDENKVRELTSSATEKEIVEGLLECEGISDNTIALFRSNYPEKDEDQEKIINLKKRIVEKMSSDGCAYNVIELDWNSDYENKFEEIVTATLIKNIDSEISRLSHEKEKAYDKEELNVIFESAGVVFDRNDELARLNDYVNGESNKPLYLYGDSGSGKTTLLAQFVHKSTEHIFYSFYGLGETSFTLLSSIQKLSNDIKYYFKIQKGFYVNEFNLSEVFLYALNSIPKEEKAIIIIDGFEMFHDISEIRERVVPANLPENVKMIISSANLDVVKRLADDDSQVFKLDWLDSIKSENLFDLLLKQKNRCIVTDEQKAIVSTVLKNGATPLQLKMMSEECLSWHSSDVVEAFPDYVEAIALRHLTNMFIKFGHNKELVLYALALICAAPYGITEEELQALLLRFESVRNYFISEDRYEYNMKKLPFAVWSRLFYDLKGCLTLVRVKGIIMVRFTHQVFYRAFLKQFKKYYDAATDVLVSYYDEEPNYANDGITPNKRKALAFAELLKKTDNIQKFGELLSNLEYVDSVIKTGNVNEVLFNIQYAMKKTQDEKTLDDLKTIYACIQKNRTMLLCYLSEFLPCLKTHVALVGSQKTVDDEISGAVENLHYFPYSADSKISWSPDGQKYAVFNSSYVYVCSTESNSELCRIYLEPNENGAITTDYVLWLDDTVIGIVTREHSVVVYDFSDYIPNLIFSKTSEAFVFSENFGAVYSSENDLLLLQSGRNLNAYNFRNGEKRYSIRLGSGGSYNALKYYVDKEENLLYIRDHKKYIRVFDVGNGDLVKTIRLKSRNSQDMITKPDVHKIDGSRFLIYSNKSRNRFAVYDTHANKQFYIHPPYYERIDALVLGERYLIFVYSDLLLIVDLMGDYQMKWLNVSGISDVAWKIKDESFSVLSGDGFRIYSVDEFKPFSEDIMCFPLKQSLFNSVFLAHKSVKRDFKIFPKLLGVGGHLNNTLDYKYILKIKDNDLEYDETDATANIVVFANDGKVAAAYEEKDTIIVYDNQKPILQIDKLRFAISNDLLKMCFSPDSKCLLLWRDDSVQVIEISSGKIKFELDVIWRPVLDVDFSENSETLKILLCDGNEYYCKITESKKNGVEKIPEKLVQDYHLDAYFGPYNHFQNSDGEYETLTYLQTLDFDYDSSIKNWFNEKRIYRGEKQWLYYEDGEFFLNGDKNKAFSHEFFDFNKCHQLQKLQESKAIRYYLAEKNDLFSKLFEYGKHLVLVSRMLNSVILFDTESMEVISAYKPQGSIIGFVENKTAGVIELVLDCEPYYTAVSLNPEV